MTSLLTVVMGERGTSALESEEVTFGRSPSATLKLDGGRADRSLSRLAGVFKAVDGQWQLINTATHTSLEALIDGGLGARLAPGAAPLTLPTPCTGRVQVQTARTYLIHVAVAGEPTSQLLPEPVGTETATLSVTELLHLTDSERLLLVGLAEPRLRDPEAGAWTVATTAQLHDRLGFSNKQIEDLIDSVTMKVAPYVGGLIGSNAGRAVTRRHQIVDFFIRSGGVTPGDLRALDRR